jgi:thioredoxin 1
MVDYRGKIKTGILILLGLVLVGIVLAASGLFPGTGPASSAGNQTDDAANPVYELVWNGKTNDHRTIDDFGAFMASANQPIFVDFWAEWCGPCRDAAPAVEALAQTYQGQAHIVKINTDYAGQIATAFGVTGIPHFVVIVNGEIVGETTGFAPGMESNLAGMLESALQ